MGLIGSIDSNYQYTAAGANALAYGGQAFVPGKQSESEINIFTGSPSNIGLVERLDSIDALNHNPEERTDETGQSLYCFG